MEEEHHDLQTLRKLRMSIGFDCKHSHMADISSIGSSDHGGIKPILHLHSGTCTLSVFVLIFQVLGMRREIVRIGASFRNQCARTSAQFVRVKLHK